MKFFQGTHLGEFWRQWRPVCTACTPGPSSETALGGSNFDPAQLSVLETTDRVVCDIRVTQQCWRWMVGAEDGRRRYPCTVCGSYMTGWLGYSTTSRHHSSQHGSVFISICAMACATFKIGEASFAVVRSTAWTFQEVIPLSTRLFIYSSYSWFAPQHGAIHHRRHRRIHVSQ